MYTIIFWLCVLVILLLVLAITYGNQAKDLERKLRRVESEYGVLEKKYQTVRRFCIKDNGRIPEDKYFVVGWLNMMQNIHTEKWYYISDENLSNMGCDMDGDIITIMHAKKEEDGREDE